MLAEVNGKLSPESSQDFERLEDLLTDYVFGSLKRLPRSALRSVIETAFPELNFSAADADAARFEFWPTWVNTEPDVAIVIGSWLIVIEAKLWSGFGVGSTLEHHQLVREYRRAAEQRDRRRLKGPLIIAVTAGFERPADLLEANEHIRAQEHVVLDDADPIRWLSWQQVAGAIEDAAHEMERRDQESVADLLDVMDRRGVRRVFGGFAREDYWLLAAAKQRASEVVFPAIATFCQDVMARLDEVGIRRAASDQRVVAYHSASIGNPQRWGWSYLFLPLWPTSWPRKRKWDPAYLFVQFSLKEPEVWVGFRQAVEPRQVEDWRPHLQQYVTGMASHPGYRVSVSKYPDFADPLAQTPSEDIDRGWMEAALDRAGCSLAFYRALSLDDLTSSAVVADMIEEDRALVESMPFILEATIELASR